MSPPISPLSLNQMSRDLWGLFDPMAIAQLAPLAFDPRYQPKFYKAPDLASEVFAPYAYVDFGLEITRGSWIYAVCLPADPATWVPKQFTLQITDNSLKDANGKPHKFWDEPIPSFMVGNYCPNFSGHQPPADSVLVQLLQHAASGDGRRAVLRGDLGNERSSAAD